MRYKITKQISWYKNDVFPGFSQWYRIDEVNDSGIQEKFKHGEVSFQSDRPAFAFKPGDFVKIEKMKYLPVTFYRIIGQEK